MTPAEARTTLLQAISARADHARFISIESHSTERGVRLLWRDYLAREEGTLLTVPEKDIEASVSSLLAALREWRAAASSLKPLPAQLA